MTINVLNAPQFRCCETAVAVPATAKINHYFLSKDFQQFCSAQQIEPENMIPEYIHHLALARNEAEEAIVHQVIREFYADPKSSESNLEARITKIAITFVEKVSGKHFNASERECQAIAEEVMERLENCFHGTNWGAFEHIKVQGLRRQRPSFDDSELKAIDSIAKRIFKNPSFSWFSIYNNQGNAFYVAGKASTSVKYATNSPEWFYFFLNHLTGKERPHDAQARINEAIDKLPSITPEESKTLKVFAQKYLAFYGSQRTAVVLSVRTPDLMQSGLGGKPKTHQEVLEIFKRAHQEIRACRAEKNSLHQQLFNAIRYSVSVRLTWVNERISDRDFPPENITAYALPLSNLTAT